MERMPFLICDKRQMEVCKYAPECERLQKTKHHLSPRRLLKIARELQASEAYQSKLKRVICHPNNIVEAPRCLHDYLDSQTTDTLPAEEALDTRLAVWETA